MLTFFSATNSSHTSASSGESQRAANDGFVMVEHSDGVPPENECEWMNDDKDHHAQRRSSSPEFFVDGQFECIPMKTLEAVPRGPSPSPNQLSPALNACQPPLLMRADILPSRHPSSRPSCAQIGLYTNFSKQPSQPSHSAPEGLCRQVESTVD